MDKKFSRRKLFALVPVAISPLAGCVPEAGSASNLGVAELNVAEVNGTYRINITAKKSGTGDPFRNVSVVVKNSEDEIVCQQFYADTVGMDNNPPMNFTCDQFPHIITYEFDGDECSDDISVNKLVYVPDEDVWNEERVSCD